MQDMRNPLKVKVKKPILRKKFMSGEEWFRFIIILVICNSWWLYGNFPTAGCLPGQPVGIFLFSAGFSTFAFVLYFVYKIMGWRLM